MFIGGRALLEAAYPEERRAARQARRAARQAELEQAQSIAPSFDEAGAPVDSPAKQAWARGGALPPGMAHGNKYGLMELIQRLMQERPDMFQRAPRVRMRAFNPRRPSYAPVPNAEAGLEQ